MQRGRPAKQQRRDADESHREHHHAEIDGEHGPSRELVRQQRQQQHQHPPSGDDAQKPSAGGEHDVLDQQLPHQPEPARAEREADSHFALTRQRPREHDCRHVRARDRQQHRDRAADRRHGGAIVGARNLAQRPDEGRDDVLFILRVPDRLMRPLQIGVSGGDGHAGLQPADRIA